MKNLIIIGAGGMGREVFSLAKQCIGYNKVFTIKGFIDDRLNTLASFSNTYPPIIENISNYQVEKDDVFICSIGDVKIKRACIDIIIKKGGKFISLVHPMAIINETASIGEGVIVFPYAIVGSEAIVGKHTLLQSYSVIAHDVVLGDFCRIDVQSVCIGGVKIGNCVTIHTASIINHKVVVEDNAKIAAGSFVIKKVKKSTTVHGNPAVVL